MNILVLDNYDSFTYNLVHYIEDIVEQEIDVYRNDEIDINIIDQYDLIILSPGPGIPNEAGILKDVIKKYADKIPILGVCLGLQAVVEVFGGELENLNEAFHGVATKMVQKENNARLFQKVSKEFQAARYHSWIASKKNFPSELKIICEDEDGNIMAIQHRKHIVEAVQFHPESILTPLGKQMIKSFIDSLQ